VKNTTISRNRVISPRAHSCTFIVLIKIKKHIQMNDLMQKIFYTIAVILLVVGAVIYWGFRPFDTVHGLILASILLLFIGLYFTYKITKKYRKTGKL